LDNLIEKQLSFLYGKPSWNVQKGHGSFLTFEFGNPLLKIEDIYETSGAFGFSHRSRPTHVHGEWHLWIYLCDWHISWKDKEIAHSESDDLTIHRACSFLNGQALKSVATNAYGSTSFTFDLDGFIKTASYPSSEIEDTWMLFCPDSRVISLQSDGCFKITMNNESSSG
jgi:hypothetical protein